MIVNKFRKVLNEKFSIQVAVILEAQFFSPVIFIHGFQNTHYIIGLALFKERKEGLSEFCTGGSTVENIVVKYGTKKFGHIYTI